MLHGWAESLADGSETAKLPRVSGTRTSKAEAEPRGNRGRECGTANKRRCLIYEQNGFRVLCVACLKRGEHRFARTRMGTRAKDSVLTRNAEARWAKRLFVADNAALANALGRPNPTLTTQALATRTAQKIFQIYFVGAPRVKKESPILSIDLAVTNAVMARGL